MINVQGKIVKLILALFLIRLFWVAFLIRGLKCLQAAY
jgi:hypothetical protein